MFPPAAIKSAPAPSAGHGSGMRILQDAFDATRRMIVPQLRDGDCEVRRIWDEAAAKVMGESADKLRKWRRMLAEEPATSRARPD